MNVIKKPPDKYRTVKCSIKSIIKKDLDMNILFNAMMRTHKIVIHTYQFLRLWILNKYHNNLNIPLINDDVIKMAFKSLIIESSGPKPKGTNLNLFNEFKLFYESQYKNLNYNNKIDGKNLSQILGYMSIDMLTNIENNVKMHFFKYVKKFVNSSFRIINNTILEIVNDNNKSTVTRNVQHLEIMLSKEWFSEALTQQQLTDINSCIANGNTYTAEPIIEDIETEEV